MRFQVALGLLFLSSATCMAASADPRAVESCKKSGAFTEIAACLPDADVSIKTLDAFTDIYPGEAKPLKDKCEALNKDDLTAAAACLTNAIEDAIELKGSLPEGTDLGDPVFEAVAKKALSEKLKERIQAARSGYPKKMIWGGTMYQQYK